LIHFYKRDHPLVRCISMLISRSLIIAFVLISLGCISSQGAALGADDRRTNDITCYDFCVWPMKIIVIVFSILIVIVFFSRLA